MHRVLGIPELLDIIFGMLDQMSNAGNAQVCKRWSQIALDALWKDVHDLTRLFGILAPLRKVGTSEELVSTLLSDIIADNNSINRSSLSYLTPYTGNVSRDTVLEFDG